MKLTLTLLVLIVFCQSILATPFKSWYYFDKDGKKIEGLIKFRRATFSAFGSKPGSILFEETEDAKTIKLTANDISSFVIGNDSFAIVYNIKVNSIEGEYAKDFAKVIIAGAMNLHEFKFRWDGQLWYWQLCFFKRWKHLCWNMEYKKTKRRACRFFSGNADIKNRILNKEFDKKIPDPVKEYKSKKN
jgi:hypothetical protein